LAGAVLSELGGAAREAATSLIDGLVNGIKNGAGRVIAAVKGLGGDAVSALNNALGNHSPSRYAIEAASNVTHTFADTIDKGSGAVQGSMADMIEPPDLPPSGGKRAGDGGGAKSGHTFSIVINAGDGSAQSIAAAVEQTLNRILEGDVLRLGGLVETTA
jgi:hypothetical protein